MTDKTWFGGTGSFTDASDWSPTGVPVVGDSITLGVGTLEVTDKNLLDIPVTMGSFRGATLDLDNSILGNVTLTVEPSPTFDIGSNHTINISGSSVFGGFISTTPPLGQAEIADFLTINIAKNSTLLNTGIIEIKPQIGDEFTVNGATGSKLVNDGLIEVEAPDSVTAKISTDVLGFGSIAFSAGDSGSLEFTGSVGAQQTVGFSGGVTASDLLKIDSPAAFEATIANFTNTDTISLQHATVTSHSFHNGVLTLDDGSHAVAHLHFAGSYTTSDFTTSVVGGDTLIKFT